MSNEIPTPKRGRPSGSNSFIRMRLSDLAARMGENCVVPVSKVWLRENGIQATELAPTIIATAPVPAVEKVAFVLTTFEDEGDDKVDPSLLRMSPSFSEKDVDTHPEI